MKRVLSLSALRLAGCAAPAFVVTHALQDDAAAREVEAHLQAGRPLVERAVGVPLRTPVAVTVAPTRAAFDATFPPEWGIPETQCWMVAWGVADKLAVLSPRAWAAEACEHDAADAGRRTWRARGAGGGSTGCAGRWWSSGASGRGTGRWRRRLGRRATRS
jgi:hypothetical protein